MQRKVRVPGGFLASVYLAFFVGSILLFSRAALAMTPCYPDVEDCGGLSLAIFIATPPVAAATLAISALGIPALARIGADDPPNYLGTVGLCALTSAVTTSAMFFIASETLEYGQESTFFFLTISTPVVTSLVTTIILHMRNGSSGNQARRNTAQGPTLSWVGVTTTDESASASMVWQF